jgi:hypothetical protein
LIRGPKDGKLWLIVMKKQNILNKVNLLPALFVLFASFAYLLLPRMTASAAAAACYVGTGSNFRVAACDIGNPRHGYFNSAGTKLTSLPDNTCYQQDVTASVGGVVYRQNDCAALASLVSAVDATAPDLCTTSGGTWNASAAAGSQCTCVSGDVYSPTSRQCVTPATSPTSGTGDIPVADGPKVDCNAQGGTDLSAENCGIIGLLNTAFNFVSGGVALAVVANIIYAGIQYSTAQGDPSAVGKSKKRITGALIAFLMYVSLYAFIQWLIPGGVF